MGLDDYRQMAEILAGIKGKFILSINDRTEIRKVFKGFSVKAVSLKYSVKKEGSTEGKELLVCN